MGTFLMGGHLWSHSRTSHEDGRLQVYSYHTVLHFVHARTDKLDIGLRISFRGPFVIQAEHCDCILYKVSADCSEHEFKTQHVIMCP